MVDAGVYAVSFAFACCLWSRSAFVTFRTWGGLAAPGYLVGTLGALALGAMPRMAHGVPLVRDTERARRVLLCVVAAVVMVIPVAWLAHQRLAAGPQYAQSEVPVVEQATRLVLHGSNPYASTFSVAELAGRAPGIRDHYPYLPGMFGFGIPRAIFGAHAWTDARVYFFLGSSGALLAAFVTGIFGMTQHVRLWQALMVAPPGALALATGGDDVPVVALCLLSLALMYRRSETAGVVVLLLASLLKLTAWPMCLAVVFALRSRGSVRHALVLGLTPLAVLMALVCVVPGAAADLLAYPMGMTKAQTPARSPTLGSALFSHLGALPPAVDVLLLVLVAGGLTEGALWLIRRAAPASLGPEGGAVLVAARFSILLTTLIFTAPVARPGYLIYPLNAIVWAWCLHQGDDVSMQSPRLVQPGRGGP